MEICAFLLSATIVGAYEFTPGSMRVEVLDSSASNGVGVAFVYTDTYLRCMERPQQIEQTEE